MLTSVVNVFSSSGNPQKDVEVLLVFSMGSTRYAWTDSSGSAQVEHLIDGEATVYINGIPKGTLHAPGYFTASINAQEIVMGEPLSTPHRCMVAVKEDGMNIERVIEECYVPIFLWFDVTYIAKNLETGQDGVTVRCNAFCLEAVIQNPLSLEHIPECHRSLVLCELALHLDQNAKEFLPRDIFKKASENYKLVGNNFVWEPVDVDKNL
ncbi:MAG: hypothetical protein QNL04_06615, partial [SAR324 cluster bacterium]|nr:hypothetical protein [SAR324 cluster bacterium]